MRKNSGGRHNEEVERTWSVLAAGAFTLREMDNKSVEDRGEASEEWEPHGSVRES